MMTAAAAAVIISKSLKNGWAPGEGERAISIRVYYTTTSTAAASYYYLLRLVPLLMFIIYFLL